MDLNSKIRVVKIPDVTDLAGEKVMIDFETGKYFMLTGAANDIWDMLKDGVSISDITSGLMESYDVDERECLRSTADFLNKLRAFGFIELYD